MKPIHVMLMVFLLPALAWAGSEPPSTVTPPQPSAAGAGTVIVGERNAAVGLFLLPWREEAASDIDLAPRLHDPVPRAEDLDAMPLRVIDAQANAAYRRVRGEARYHP